MRGIILSDLMVSVLVVLFVSIFSLVVDLQNDECNFDVSLS